MKFIYADSLDYVDPKYDFAADEHAPGRRPYWDDVFAHELLEEPPYDGLLVSRALMGGAGNSGKYSEAQAMRFAREGARRFLRLNQLKFKDVLLFGDCGAFSYSKASTPPYKPVDMVEFYEACEFTHGCSIDHIIFDFSDEGDGSDDAKRRYQITLDLADQFISEHRRADATFIPIGVIQGWSPGSMASAAKALVDMGFRYLAIGGLVPLRIESIRKAVAAVHEAIRHLPEIKIHLLGFAKAEHIDELARYQVASFDSTSPLLRAFKDNTRNYWRVENGNRLQYFSAIRVPQADSNVTLQHRIKRGEVVQERLREIEQAALALLRAYDRGEAPLDQALDQVIEYSRFLLESPSTEQRRVEKKLTTLRSAYEETLTAKPWKECDCSVCRECSIEVVLFRASNRNKRRGIHNLHAFHQHVSQLRGVAA